MMPHTSSEEFETLNWLPITERFNQYIHSVVFKHVNDQCPNYQSKTSKNNIQTRGCFQKSIWIQPYGAKPLRLLSKQNIST